MPLSKKIPTLLGMPLSKKIPANSRTMPWSSHFVFDKSTIDRNFGGIEKDGLKTWGFFFGRPTRTLVHVKEKEKKSRKRRSKEKHNNISKASDKASISVDEYIEAPVDKQKEKRDDTTADEGTGLMNGVVFPKLKKAVISDGDCIVAPLDKQKGKEYDNIADEGDAGKKSMSVKLLTSPSDDVREQAVWALGNIVGDSPRCRDLVFGQGALIPLLSQLNEHAKLSMLRNATWTLSSFCRGKPQPPFELTKPALPALERLVELLNILLLQYSFLHFVLLGTL